jgi:hypothetical protein
MELSIISSKIAIASFSHRLKHVAQQLCPALGLRHGAASSFLLCPLEEMIPVDSSIEKREFHRAPSDL